MGESKAQDAVRRLEVRLQELGIPYAVAGGLAVVAHGHVRVSQNVDVLLTPAGLQRFKDASLGCGWLERVPGGRRLRDAVGNVAIDVLVTGRYRCCDKPRGVRFPDPAEVAATVRKGRVLALPVLVEPKPRGGLWTRDRPRDSDDVIQLIRANDLPAGLAERLHEEVRAKYCDLWHGAQNPSSES